MAEVLTQAEINQLISDLSHTASTGKLGDADKSEERGTDKAREKISSHKIKTYDFRIPEKFSRYHIHAAHAINDIFARLASTALSVYLKAKVDVEVASVDQMTYEEYSKSIVVSSVNTVFSLEPLIGSSIIQFNLSVIFTAIDKLLGGPGWSLTKESELTDLERSLIEGLIMKVLSVFKESWSNVIEITPKIEIIECNPMFLPRIASPKETVLLGTFEIRISESSGIMSVCIPYGVIEPILSRFSSSDLWASKDRLPMDDGSFSIRRKLLETLPIPAIVELGSSEISLNDLLSLQHGNVICLNKGVYDELEVKLMGVSKFLARPGVMGENMGIQITSTIEEVKEEISFNQFDYYGV
jgi:flagellar motor switch protein FliM